MQACYKCEMFAVAADYLCSLSILEVDPKAVDIKIADVMNFYYYGALWYSKRVSFSL
jgi:hypothetical protein